MIENHFDLYSNDEIVTFKAILNLSVDGNVGAQTLISRMILRKHEWMKVSSFREYLIEYGDSMTMTVDESKLMKSLMVLVDSQLIDLFSSDNLSPKQSLEFDSLWSAVECSFSAEEVAHLYHAVTNRKDGKALGNKINQLTCIKRIVTSQKSLFGAPLLNLFPKFVQKALKMSKSTSLTRPKPAVRILLRRAQRLYQVKSFIKNSFDSEAYTVYGVNCGVDIIYRSSAANSIHASAPRVECSFVGGIWKDPIP